MGDFLKKIKIIISVALFITSVFCFTTTSFAAQVDGKYVTLGGETFGVKFYNDGVIIVQLEDFYDGEKYVCPAKSSGLAVNDIIKKANGNDIIVIENGETNSKNQSSSALNEFSLKQTESD